MRIVLLSVDDEYAGAMQKYLYASRGEWIVGSLISSCIMYKKNPFGAALTLLWQSGPRYPFEMLKMKVLRKLIYRTAGPLPSRLAEAQGLIPFRSGDINSQECRAWISSLEPDLLISTNFNHYIGKHVRNIPRCGTWNLHKSLLPDFRGMAPGFHALLEGRQTAGATLHVVEKGFDTGGVLSRTSTSISSSDSVYSLSMRIADSGGRMLSEYLQSVDLDRLDPVPQPAGEWKNYSYPSALETRRFLRRGLRFM